MPESFIVLALPHSTRSDDVHVSLFLAPRLTTTDPDATLRDFPTFADWESSLASGTVTLRDQDGVIESRVDPRVEAGLWGRFFDPATPVGAEPLPDWSNRRVHSFDVRNVTTLAKVLQAATVLASPTKPPSVDEHPLGAGMLRFAERFTRYDPRFPESRHNPQVRLVYDESLGTELMDDWLAKGGPDGGPKTGPVAGADLVARAAYELHLARRFYERPESLEQQEYSERPDPDSQPVPLPERKGEFHERVTVLGDHPELLRRLGLVIDLVVDDVERLGSARWLQGVVEVDGAACKRTRVRCRRTTDGALVTVPGTSDWHDGALALGNEQRFTVVDVDADGSALKADRFLWSIPRINHVEENGNEIDAANPALRSPGLTIARTGQGATSKERVSTQNGYDATFRTSDELTDELAAEDVTRGMRVEVWDDHSGTWHSLHTRRTLFTDDSDQKIVELDNDGFIQGTSATTTPGADDTKPVYVHEAMFGWEGWSLSAPRPGRRIRPATPDEYAAMPADDKRTEIVEDADTPDPHARTSPHPFRFRHRVKGGTLPRLRFGRSYAFRAWQVDLAGNVRPAPGPALPVAPDDLTATLEQLGQVTPTTVHADGAPLWSAALRETTATLLTTRALGTPPEPEPVLDDGLRDVLVARMPDLTRLRQVAPGRGVDVSRRALVDSIAAQAVTDTTRPLFADTARTDAASLSPLIAAHLAHLGLAGSLSEVAVEALKTVTRPVPFLRWDPVQPPAAVARWQHSEGESLQVLVVRSGVTQDLATGAITVTDPATYAAEHGQYHKTAERHLAPPKTTQFTAELHGKFDDGIGDGATELSLADAMLGIALAEDGSLLDVDRADLDNPGGPRLAQDGVALVTSAAVPQAELKTLPLKPGEAPAPGQYVVHDTEDLVLPYLPDPLAEGISFRFPEAGLDRALPQPFGVEGFTAAYAGAWPRVEPFRLVLGGSTDGETHGRVDGREVHVELPPGDQQKLTVSSSLPRDGLDLLGPWRTVSSAFTTKPEVREAAVDGWLWALTPSERWSLVHAVPRPLEAPRPVNVKVRRFEGQTSATLMGSLDLHGPSTDSVSGEAAWVEVSDDLTLDRYTETPLTETPFSSMVRPFEDIAVLAGSEAVLPVPDVGLVGLHDLTHRFNDTKHRRVTYRFRASTRFREYFAPALLEGDPEEPLDDGRSVLSAPLTLDVPSSARPAPPVVHSVVPLFRWDKRGEPEQPMARRHVRRSGVRIYLERPWFSSGEGELLAVLLAPPGARPEPGAYPWVPGTDTFGPAQEDESGFPFVSKVGGDPIWWSAEVKNRALQPLQLDDILDLAGYDDRDEPARPVAAPAESLDLPALGSSYPVRVLGYQPHYNEARGLWYVDVALNPATTLWSFVRLAVARYQPWSVDDCHLSAPVRCDFVQLPPERTTSVSRTDGSHVRVVVSGPVGAREHWSDTPGRGKPFAEVVGASRKVVARLQQRDPLLNSDLGWTTVTTQELAIRSADPTTFTAAWVGELAAGADVILRQPPDGGPDAPSDWRVTVEEWESFPGDPPAPEDAGPLGAQFPVWEQRLVYADEVLL